MPWLAQFNENATETGAERRKRGPKSCFSSKAFSKIILATSRFPLKNTEKRKRKKSPTVPGSRRCECGEPRGSATARPPRPARPRKEAQTGLAAAGELPRWRRRAAASSPPDQGPPRWFGPCAAEVRGGRQRRRAASGREQRLHRWKRRQRRQRRGGRGGRGRIAVSGPTRRKG